MAAYNVLAAIVVFVVLFLVAHNAMKKKKESAEPGNETGTPTQTISGTLDPEPYRDNLERIEALLYSTHEPTYKDAQAIQLEARTLSGRLGQEKPWLRKLSFRVLTYGESVGSEADVGIGMISPTARRRWVDEWEKLVKETFIAKEWLQGSQERETVDSDSLATTLGDLMNTLEDMVNNAQFDMDNFGPEVTLRNLNQGDAVDRLDNWRMWTQNWISQVETAEEGLPDGLNVPQKFRPAFENTEFAIRRMKEIPNPGPGVFLGAGDERFNRLYLPAKHMRDAWLKDILRIIKQVRQLMEQ